MNAQMVQQELAQVRREFDDLQQQADVFRRQQQDAAIRLSRAVDAAIQLVQQTEQLQAQLAHSSQVPQ